ncbi:MAG: hypothetical protein ACE5H4_05935 [Candidatus Thorarchaeota archaeon]
MDKEYAQDLVKILRKIDKSTLCNFLEEGEELIVEVESGEVVLSLLDGDFIVRPLMKTDSRNAIEDDGRVLRS